MQMGSLSVRLAWFVLVLIAIAIFGFAVYLDQRREAVVEQDMLTELQLQSELIRQRIEAQIQTAGEDVLYLAGTPALRRFRLSGLHGQAAPNAPSLDPKTRSDVAETFLALGEARRHYAQLRLIGSLEDARELVRVERNPLGRMAIVEGPLQRKGHRYYVSEALALPPGQIYYSTVDWNQEFGKIARPLQPTLRTATPVSDATGTALGILVINVDMRAVFEQLQAALTDGYRLYVADHSGTILWQPVPEHIFSSAAEQPRRLEDEFPPATVAVFSRATQQAQPSAHQVALAGQRGIAVVSPLANGNRTHGVTVILTRSLASLDKASRPLRGETLPWLLLLFGAAVVFSVWVLRRLTASLSSLSTAAEAIAAGNLTADLPERGPAEVKSLTKAFQHMTSEISRRQTELSELTRQLDAKVGERTRALETARQQLLEQQALQRTILDNIGDGVVVADRTGRFLLWNQVASEMIGGGPEDISPARWSEHYGLYRSEKLDEIPAEELPLARAMAGESTSEFELFIRNPALPQGRWVSVTARPLRNERGEIEGGVAILIDVTEKKQLARRRETHRQELYRAGRLALVTELADTLAHEMSQPLAAIANYAGAAIQMAHAGTLDEDRLHSLLGTISRLAERGGATLRHLKEVTQVRRVSRSPLSLRELLESSVDLLQDDLKQSDIRLSVDLSSAEARVTGDAIELEQAFLELLQNAVQVLAKCDDGERRIRVRTFSKAPSDIVVQIADNGPGVGAELAEQIFEPWVTTKQDAVGAGLAVVRTIVEAHGGRISWRRDGEFTVFEIALPTVQ